MAKSHNPKKPLPISMQEDYAQQLATGKGTQAERYARAGYTPNSSNAASLAKAPHIAARVEYLRSRVQKKAELSRAWLLKQLMENIEQCMTPGETYNPAAANKAIEMLGREEFRMFTERRLNIHKRWDELTEEECLEILGGEPEPAELTKAANTRAVGHA